MPPAGNKKMSPKEILMLMKVKNWSQGELGRQLEVEPSTISRWINGTVEVSGPAKKLMRIWLDAEKGTKQPA